ncbi:DNA sulfur modification protein DndD [Candidatus Accumulibacter aalborgensis]|uniref:DNA sulfur modification protein DndD n=1 Tax=Candidatus Accumulibacter aalborgensis TaxID=1860102 RepID=A0A1A8XH43_9PROT|nr:DNA sulfur modification protein DndD [Candidatus Accumulibacter aalborgensis]SBT03692.1 DNA sulfur modification protein DndD [Candidatus Accumulibacter aalborgensis]
MKFRKLTIENYKSFQFPTEIVFPMGEDGRSIFLIGGMNGAGKTSIMEAVTYCLYGGKADDIFRHINRREKAKGNANVAFEIVIEMDDGSELVVKRSWTAGAISEPRPRDLTERLVVVRDGKRVSVQNQEIWQDFIRAAIPPGITQFFFFDGEKIQEIAADDHSEVRLKSSLEAALGIQYINRLASDIIYIKQEERKGFVEISDEDLEFKQSELKREKSKLARKVQERESLRLELEGFKGQLDEARKRFEASFHAAPESREAMREQEKKRVSAANRLAQVESEIRGLCEKVLPFSIAGKVFDGIRRQIDAERELASGEAIKENAATLAKRIVRVVEEPEPIYTEKLSAERMAELERRIFRLLKEGDPGSDITKVLDLSERDAARVLNRMEALDGSDVFLLKPLLDEARGLEVQKRQFEGFGQGGALTSTERDLFDELQGMMEGCSTQIGRKTEQLRLVEEDILTLGKKIRDIEVEIEKLYEKHHISKEKAEFIEECDAIASVLNQFIVRLRKNKVHLLQEKTFEMYRLLSSRSGLIKDITIDDKTYEVRITDRNGHQIRKSSMAAGEKEVFAVSLLWGLAQTSELKLPIIIDTPLSRLDSTHRDNIVNHYFPNAGEQVVILSTDTEIDTNYYRSLKPRLSGAGCLEFDQRQELTTFRKGYFWEKNHG